jgi:hypothetical protein
MNGPQSSPVSCSHNLGAWTLGVRLIKNALGASDSTLGGQDPSIVRGDVVCKRGSVTLSVSNALASDLADTKGALQTIAESRANSGALSPVNASKGVAHCRKTYDVVGFSRGASDDEVVRPASSVVQEVICGGANNLALVDLKGSSGSHTNEGSKGEGVLHDSG